jgi:hypothetical protein
MLPSGGVTVSKFLFVSLITAIMSLVLISSTSDLHGFPEKRTVKNRVELGQVKWLRNFDEGKAQAKKEKKPVLVMFQEVPG